MKAQHKYLPYYQKAMLAQERYRPFLHLCEKPLRTRQSGPTALEDLVVAVKDNILVEGLPATAASKKLEGFIAPYNATVIRRLLKEGASIIGKTNLDEFAMGSSNENSAYGPVLNPWDENRVPGGSSGGSAVAVALDICDAALGSDTGGSIRQPSAFCGVTGLKPTYGAVSRYGLIALASSLDQIGPIARSAQMVERIFQVISGADEFDQTTVSYRYQSRSYEIEKLKIALPKELWGEGIEQPIKRSCREFLSFFKERGAKVETISLPALNYALNAYYIILPAEASSNLARYDGIRFRWGGEEKNLLDRYLNARSKGFGKEVKRRILLGTFVLSVGHYDQYYQQAVRAKKTIIKQYGEAFAKYDLIVSPTTPTLAFELGSRLDDPVKMYQSDILTVSVNLAGLPAISVPCGFEGRLPIGVQLIADYFREDLLLDLAKQYQAKTNYHLARPKVLDQTSE